MRRPTIRNLAEAAGVSVATVNRVLSGSDKVRPSTMQRVQDAAQSIGFYGLGSIQDRIAAARSRHRFGFLLNQPTRVWYRQLGRALEEAAANVTDRDVETQVEFAEDLSPQNMSAKLLELGEQCDAVGVVAAVHPLITHAVDELSRRDVPVFALISQLTATPNVHYVGLDNWKVGRTSAWGMAHICNRPGKVGILVGNHRYRCQEMNESGFRSYFREYAPEFTLLEPLSTFETTAVAQEMTEKLLREHPDLAGLYVAGGGITGVVAALRASDLAGRMVTVGYELVDVTRAALLDGVLTMIISHPLPRLAEAAIAGMIKASSAPRDAGNQTTILPFDIFTRENI